MDRECFVTLVEEVLDALPAEFRKKIHNLTVVVEDQPPKRLSRKTRRSAQKPGAEKCGFRAKPISIPE